MFVFVFCRGHASKGTSTNSSETSDRSSVVEGYECVNAENFNQTKMSCYFFRPTLAVQRPALPPKVSFASPFLSMRNRTLL